MLGATSILVFWTLLLRNSVTKSKRSLGIDIVLRKQHYIQACAQLSVYLYWGWYWREVYDSAHLIAAQLLFAYAFDMLLTWSRREKYILGFGPFPIIFSINLFMWFKPDWFYLQFLMVAVGFAVKEFIRWNKNGKNVHIFNPSSFPLGIFALGLILTGSTSLTWGPEIAVTQIFPPHIYLVIFLASLPAQLLFGVAPMTMAAVATTYIFILIHSYITGTQFFSPSDIGGGAVPIAAFLGMHLLFNDPSTSPRTEVGRVFFGVLYGIGIIILFGVLEQAGIPTHYDKLLAVPILNLLIQIIDVSVRSSGLSSPTPSPREGHQLSMRRNLSYVTAWIIFFAVMQARTTTEVALARGVSLLSQNQIDDTVKHYQDLIQSDPHQAKYQNELGYVLLRAGRGKEALTPLLRAAELDDTVPQTHNSLGAVYAQTGRWSEAVQAFRRSIELQPDYPEAQFNLAQLYDEGRGVIENDSEAVELYRSAAGHGHLGAQVNLGRMYKDGRGVSRDDQEAVRWYNLAASQGHPFAQYNLALMYRAGEGTTPDNVAAYMWFSIAASRLESDSREIAITARLRAVEALRSLEEAMSESKIREARQLADSWSPDIK
tara:strand:+ start:11597 stop:13399 length:1803 start_codon:yes stop_codon:yes gene_type:complete